MDFPKRTIPHKSESASLKILQSLLPEEWIIRELTERDYGIDLYIELAEKDGSVTGKLAALQVKGTHSIDFNEDGVATFGGIKKSTINYWINLPIPVFFVVVDLEKKHAYWSCVDENEREGRFFGSSATFSLIIKNNSDFSLKGLVFFELTYIREKKWPEIEIAIEKSVMLYSTLGPLTLMCRRGHNNSFCSTSIQYIIIQHYEYFTILSRYLLGMTPKPLPDWYFKNLHYIESNGLTVRATFTYGVMKEMISYFMFDYRQCILAGYELITESQRIYFSKKFPHLRLHLESRPPTFILEDWAARYYFDEYQTETTNPEKLFFKDFDDFDRYLSDIKKN